MILTEALRLYCKEHKITLRQLENETKVPKSVLDRFLKGENIRSDYFVSLLAWATQTVPQNLPAEMTEAERSVRQDALIEE